MSLSTTEYPTEAGPTPVYSPRRIRRRRGGRRGWIAVGALIAILLTAAGGYLAYANSLPTSVSLNLKNGQKDVPTFTKLAFSFSRPVAQPELEAAFAITPAVDGVISAVSGQTEYEWSPKQPLTDLTTYTVSLKPIIDVGHHRIAGTQWVFTTNIIPRITSITGPGGVELGEGSEILPGTVLTINFDDQMDTSTISVTMRSKPAALKWAADSRSATIATAGLPSGPLALALAPGGHDQTGHQLAGTFALNTGIYYHYSLHTTPLRYPALIQIPNDSLAWDQNGLQGADIVFEYLAEGGINRCTAIFQKVPDLVGPMRSSRFISLKIARHYKGLLFQSGESQATRARAAQDPVPQFFDTIGYQFRTPARYAPDNLMITGSKVRAAETLYPSIPTYTIVKARPTLSGGTAWPKLVVDEHYSVYSYDPMQGTYSKTELSHKISDATTKKPLQIEMVIVVHTAEWLVDVHDGKGYHIHDFDLDSGGRAEIYYKGKRFLASWKAPDHRGPLTFIVGGQVVSLPPGLVWIDVTAA